MIKKLLLIGMITFISISCNNGTTDVPPVTEPTPEPTPEPDVPRTDLVEIGLIKDDNSLPDLKISVIISNRSTWGIRVDSKVPTSTGQTTFSDNGTLDFKTGEAVSELNKTKFKFKFSSSKVVTGTTVTVEPLSEYFFSGAQTLKVTSVSGILDNIETRSPEYIQLYNSTKEEQLKIWIIKRDAEYQTSIYKDSLERVKFLEGSVDIEDIKELNKLKTLLANRRKALQDREYDPMIRTCYDKGLTIDDAHEICDYIVGQL